MFSSCDHQSYRPIFFFLKSLMPGFTLLINELSYKIWVLTNQLLTFWLVLRTFLVFLGMNDTNFFLFQEQRAYSFCGTIEYMAPEVVRCGSTGHDIVSRSTQNCVLSLLFFTPPVSRSAPPLGFVINRRHYYTLKNVAQCRNISHTLYGAANTSVLFSYKNQSPYPLWNKR